MRHGHKSLGVESDSGMDATGRGQEREAEDSPRASPMTRAALLPRFSRVSPMTRAALLGSAKLT